MDAAFDELKKTGEVKKDLLTRSINRLRTIVGRGGKDAPADAIDAARRRARVYTEELDAISAQMETILQEDEDGATKPTKLNYAKVKTPIY